ncbi:MULTISPECIES: DUF742 domain-containing protein [Streptomyces aurantiacus group]|uniref:DUF742 domain-containing protein n=1 Tax=Streptomyces flaveus TaxID=66370 RepID=A0A917VCG3_9ACTN|nr:MULTISPECIES: DUF742 domain-containing protein [Streptomyces]GGK62497.1 hypothetical protein GCM10010094_23980 [Streptomyces flaveus]
MDDMEAEDADDAESLFVRPYTITQGRTAPARDDLTLITIVTTVEPAPGRAGTRGLQPEHRSILQQCLRPAAVAEVAAELNLPVAVTKILIDDLVGLGRVTTRPPIAMAVGSESNMTLLRAVRDGLRRI